MKTIGYIATSLLALALWGCMSDSDSLSGIEGTGSPATTASGSVTAYGSIYVNGLHIEIDTAEVSVNGASAGVDDVRLGMVVDVKLSELEDGQAVADQVTYSRALRGPVDEVVESSDVRKTLTVLGQTVVVYDDAQFEGVAFADLATGVALDVSGHIDEKGHWQASRVARAQTGEPDVRGRVTDLDEASQRFRLNALWIDYSGAEVIEGELAEGAAVRVTGGQRNAGGVLRPDTVTVNGSVDDLAGAVLFKEGIIDRFVSVADFELAGLDVDASEAKVLGRAQELDDGVRVAVKGEVIDGVLVADRLRVLRNGINRIRTPVGAVNAQAGKLTLMGSTYWVTELTAYEDVAAPAERRAPLSLAQIRVGDPVEVYAFYRRDRLVATRIKRLEPGDKTVEMRGPVTAIYPENQSIRVTGVTVWLEGAEGAELLAELSRGDKVDVRGEMNGDQLEAAELSRANLPSDVVGGCPDFISECGAGTESGADAQVEGLQAESMTLRF